tara:strand:- start:925 stop:1110 length:186 start_codon:yes stop_codon:yes gene_type:complete
MYKVLALVNSSWEYVQTNNFQSYTTAKEFQGYTESQSSMILDTLDLSLINATEIKREQVST